MKALSIHEPWATLIARGIKSIEVRYWLRIPKHLLSNPWLAIHASKTWDEEGAKDLRKNCIDVPGRKSDAYGYGHIIAAAKIVDVKRYNHHDDFMADYKYHLNSQYWGWELMDKLCIGIVFGRVVRLGVPIPAKGHQGLFNAHGMSLAGSDSNATG